MATTDIISSLFGVRPVVTPDEAETLSREKALSLGGLWGAATASPYDDPARRQGYIQQQSAQFALGDMLGRGVGSMFGAKDPELERAAAIEGTLSGLQDELSPEQMQDPTQLYPALIKRLQSAGLNKEAMVVARQAAPEMREWQLSAAKVGTERSAQAKNIAQAEKALRQEADKPLIVPAGSSVIGADGSLLFTAPKQTEIKPVVLPPGAKLVSPEGALLAEGNPVASKTRGASSTAISEAPTELQKGERWNPETGKVEAVQGSQLWQKQNSSFTKSYKAATAVLSKAQEANAKLKELLDPKNTDGFQLNFGGYNAYASRMLPKARDFANKLESVKSNLKSAGLELMRQGGSIGSMTQQEWPIVEKAIASITPELSEPEARTIINDIIARFERMAASATDIYDTEWNGTQYYKPIGGKSGKPSTAEEYFGGK